MVSISEFVELVFDLDTDDFEKVGNNAALPIGPFVVDTMGRKDLTIETVAIMNQQQDFNTIPINISLPFPLQTPVLDAR